jgi:hypothetical protein
MAQEEPAMVQLPDVKLIRWAAGRAMEDVPSVIGHNGLLAPRWNLAAW